MPTKVYVKHNIFHKKSQYMTFHVLCLRTKIMMISLHEMELPEFHYINSIFNNIRFLPPPPSPILTSTALYKYICYVLD